MDEKELGELLSSLRMSKQSGELDTDEKLARQSLKWRDTLEYHVLEASVRHQSEECRLGTLALLVESKKSTLRFTRMELDLILSFLKYNLGEQLEYVPYIKKALKRLKDSLAVMQRQLAQEEKMRNRFKEQNVDSEVCENVLTSSHKTSEQILQNMKDYATFFVDLREACVGNLYPDATYDRRRSSLQILLLMQDLLRDEYRSVEWTKEQAQTIFQCLLLDTYDSNKETAYQILKPMSPTLLNLDSEVQSMIRTAFELSNSMRPIDSVTAAYMLKISKCSPVIRDVLSRDCDVGDGVTEAATLQLVLLLERKLREVLALTKSNIGMAFIECSLYGCLFCVRSLLSDCDLGSSKLGKTWRDTIAGLILLCFELNRSVSVIVNNSSPEGHLPMDFSNKLALNDDFLHSKKTVTPQMVLLCSWRTVKEVSQLFGLLAIKASIQTDHSSDTLLTKEQIQEIMAHLVSLLCETKHRGAFEQVYVGFHQLCTRLWRLTDSPLNLLPVQWLYDILLGIAGLMPGYWKLCATRRSAGVPFMIQAVLSSEPGSRYDSETSAFRSVMKIFLRFTELDDTRNLWQRVKRIMHEDTIFSKYEHLTESLIERRNRRSDEEMKFEVAEIRIHSMNILRALFRHSQLGNVIKDYVANGLIVAFKNYDSKTWMERNAAALLFSALIVRIFGVQRTKDHINLTTDNKMTGKIFFERYPTLLPFILNELRTFISINNTEIKSNVQAILILLSRLYISYHLDETDVTWKIDEFVTLVSQCAKSPEYKTRELAARALVPLLTKSTACNLVRELFSVLRTARDARISANLTHGYLLQILEILIRMPSVGVQLLDITDLLHSTEWILKDLESKCNKYSCFAIAAAYIDILQRLHNLNRNTLVNSVQLNMDNVLHMLQQHVTEERLLNSGPAEQMYKVSAIRFILCIEKDCNFLRTVIDARTNAYRMYSRLLINRDVEIRSIAWNTLYEVLQREPPKQKRLLGSFAIRAATDLTVKQFHLYCPQTEDALFNFLYRSLTTDEYCIADKREICELVLEKIPPRGGFYSDRFSYLRVLGKCMITVTRQLKDDKLRTEHKERVYREVCNNENWISDLPEDCRSSFFDILFDLFEKNDVDPEHCYPTLQWWTMLLQLLINDNADIRRRASELVCRIEPYNELECIERTLPVFFQKFNETIAGKCPGVAIAALFYWSVLWDTLLGDTFDGIDETAVFLKYKNYNVFEPVKISELSFALTKTITQSYSIDSTLPRDALRWLNDHIPHIDSRALSFKDVIRGYGITVPTVEKKLDSILDPTYKDRLLIHSAYEKYQSLCI